MRNLGGDKQAHGLEIKFGIKRLGGERKELVSSRVETYGNVTYEIYNQFDHLIHRETVPMRSFVGNFLRLLWGRMTGTACTGGLNVGNGAIDESSGILTNLKVCGAATGLNKNGICIGSGSGAVAAGDYALTFDDAYTETATIIDTETTAGASSVSFKIRKDFTNNTGSSKVCKEAGIIVQNVSTEIDSNTNTLIAREVMNGSTGYTVANGQKIRVTFTIGAAWDTSGVVTKDFIESLEMAFRNNIGNIWQQKTASASIGGRLGCRMLTYAGKMWIIGGNVGGTVKDDVYYSTDGISWTQARASGAANGFGPRRNHTCVVMVDPADSIEKMWVIGGFTTANVNSVYSSTDGTNWTQVRADGAASGFTACRVHASCVYDGKMWVSGGLGASILDDVYYSTDGISWTLATGSAAFGTRYTHDMVVFDNKMWVISGYNGSAEDAKVYCSTNGITWTQATADGGFGARQTNNTGFVYDGKMWIVGGNSGTTYLKSVYYSADGATWTQATSDWGIGNRRDGGSCVFHGRAYYFCGADVTPTYYDSCHEMMISPFTYSGSATMPTAGRIDETSGGLYGLLVGTDSTDFAPTQTELVAKCANGTGAGQISYGSMLDAGMLVEPTESGSDTVMRIQRTITNGSGSNIDLKEIGLKCYGIDADPLLLCRQKLASTETITNGESLVVWGELKTSV